MMLLVHYYFLPRISPFVLLLLKHGGIVITFVHAQLLSLEVLFKTDLHSNTSLALGTLCSSLKIDTFSQVSNLQEILN